MESSDEPKRSYERLYPKLTPEQVDASLQAFKKLWEGQKRDEHRRTHPFIVPRQK
jgi:hypothetical protein